MTEITTLNDLLGLPPETDKDDVLGDGTLAPAQTHEEVTFAGTRRAAKRVFLANLMAGDSITQAAGAAGVAYSTACKWMRDPAFAAEVVEHRKVTQEKLVKEAERRAIRGSDRLLMFLLQANDPKKYNPATKLEHSGSIGIADAILEARKRTGGSQ